VDERGVRIAEACPYARGVPSLTIASAAAMGPFVKFQLRALQATGAATRCYAELSGAVYGRPA
jgi:hypothetical protein